MSDFEISDEEILNILKRKAEEKRLEEAEEKRKQQERQEVPECTGCD